jgi:hypothetical protein
MITNRLERSWRTTAMWMLTALIAVCAVALVFDGGRPAVAAGDCQYQPYAPYGDPCPPAELTLSIAAPTEGVVGNGLGARATLSGGANPTGTLTFTLHPPGDERCATPSYTSSVRVDGAREYTDGEGGSVAIPTSAGIWRWKVVYSGDASHGSLATGCDEALVTVSKAPMFLYLYSPFGQQQSIPGGLTVYGASGGYQPTGAVTVRLFGPNDPTCTGAPAHEQAFRFDGASFVNIDASVQSTDQLGVWRWQADYPGDASHEAVALPCGQTYVDVGRARPYLTAGAFPGSVAVGGSASVGGSIFGGYQPTGDRHASPLRSGRRRLRERPRHPSGRNRVRRELRRVVHAHPGRDVACDGRLRR